MLPFLHTSNALLVIAVYVKMKLGDNTLNNERLSLLTRKLSIKNNEFSKSLFMAG